MIESGSTIGILGGGQLGRMMAMAAAEMGYHVHIYCPEQDAPASEVAQQTTHAAYDDAKALTTFAKSVDVITYEFENIPANAAIILESHAPVRPSPDILTISQHRIAEKQAINALGIATAPFAPVRSFEELEAAVKKLNTPCVLKTCRMGYDGKGQAMILSDENVEEAWKQLCHPEHSTGSPSVVGNSPQKDMVLEGFIRFRIEISVIVARDTSGNIQCYCPVQNTHKHHILHETTAPALISPALTHKAETIARTIADGLKLVGLMAIEMFVTEQDDIIVNELAPRPHNSGHWTMDACITSQFTQAIRAVCGLPLGDPARLCDATMLNLIGDDVLEWEKYAAMPNAKLHLYGKKEARPGRKMGHVNFLRIT